MWRDGKPWGRFWMPVIDFLFAWQKLSPGAIGHCHCAYLCAYYIVLHNILFMLHLLLDHSANIKIKVKKKYLYVNIISNTLLR